MAEQTNIEWADSTLNLWIGCTKVSAACDHCYAEALMDKRMGRVIWGPHGKRSMTKTWGDATRWNKGAADFYDKFGRRRLVFVNSLSDFFDNHKSVVWRPMAYDLFRTCRDVTFMLLTKRPQNMKAMLPDDWPEAYPNVWLGTTAENQEEFDRRVPHLIATKAAKRFISYEPALGPIDFGDALNSRAHGEPYQPPPISWVIAGGESGPSARPPHPDWFRSARDQCSLAGVSFFFKQWGEWAPIAGGRWEGPEDEIGSTFHADIKRGDIWMRRDGLIGDGKGDTSRPPRIWTPAEQAILRRVGKKTAGALLDGRSHRELPL